MLEFRMCPIPGLDAMNGRKMAVVGLCVALAAALRWSLSLVWPDITVFVTFYPAIVAVTFAYGVEAGVLAIVLTALTCWWIFIPPPFAFFPLKQDDVVSITLFILSCAIIVAMIEPHVRDEEEQHGRPFTASEE
jgi:K+-sensing histidine kinase KdpD